MDVTLHLSPNAFLRWPRPPFSYVTRPLCGPPTLTFLRLNAYPASLTLEQETSRRILKKYQLDSSQLSGRIRTLQSFNEQLSDQLIGLITRNEALIKRLNQLLDS